MTEEMRQETERKESAGSGDNRLYAWIGLGSLLLLLATALLFIWLPKSAYSGEEKRALAQLPALSGDSLLTGEWMDRTEDYAADHFPLRAFWMRVKTNTLRLLGERESQGVFYASDGSLIQAFQAYDETRIGATAGAVRAFAEEYGFKRAVFLLVPTAVSLYPEKLPAYGQTASEADFVRSFKAELGEDFLAPDVQTIFQTLKEAGVELYYGSDHHWTSPAAYGLFSALAEELRWKTGSFRPGVVSNGFMGSLASKSGFTPKRKDAIILYERTDEASLLVIHEASGESSDSLYDAEALKGTDPYTVFLGGNEPLLTIRTTADTERTLLVLKDSYANCFLPFLTDSYKTITVVDPRYFAEPLSTLFLQGGYTDVLFLYNVQTLAEDESLRIVLEDALKEAKD